MSDKAVCMGEDGDGCYYVFTPRRGENIALGDVLEGTFDGSTGLTKEVQNETRHQTIEVIVEDWNCPPSRAQRSLSSIYGPTKIYCL